MSGGFDIHNLLQTGYFTTSRAKDGQPKSPGASSIPENILAHSTPRYHDVHPNKSVVQRKLTKHGGPPPPTVEEEADSLAREHGAPPLTVYETEEPHSKGEADQYPLILEVHEHNPERRFVILEGAGPQGGAGAVKPSSDQGDPKRTKTHSSSRPTTPNADSLLRPKSPLRQPIPTTRETSASSNRSRRRPDLPPVNTGSENDKAPRHHRTQSANPSRPPEYLSPRTTRQFGETLLSPQVMQHGGKRDRVINSYGQPQRTYDGEAPRRSQSHVPEDRRRVDAQARRSPSPGPGKRATSSATEATKSRRRLSMNRDQESRQRDGKHSASSSIHSLDYIKDDPRSSVERLKADAPLQPLREASRSGDERLPNVSRSDLRQPKVIIDQDGKPDTSHTKTNNNENTSSIPTKRSSITAPAQKLSANVAELPRPRSSATFPINLDDRKARSRMDAPLPYPDDDQEPPSGRPKTPTRAADWPDMARPKVAPSGPRPVPGPSQVPPSRNTAAAVAAAAGAGATGLLQTPTTLNSGEDSTWPPPKFDPERDGLRPDAPTGAFRRFSEGKDNTGPPDFPACPRVKPIAGKVDWLTLPRTDFNICPTCYEEVFSKTTYRTEFQPMLRPMDQPLVCDFGTSPWYRIAWLMVWHNKLPDLRILHQISNIASAAKSQSCPGSKKSIRKWYTVWDPADRQPIAEFPVCYQCAMTVEALLPNLSGLFKPLDPRSDSDSWRTCELHFTPERKRFVLYFDILERGSEKTVAATQKAHVAQLAKEIEKLSLMSECREDSPVSNGHWHVMQFLPQFTVCGDCFDDVVRPKLDDRNVLARNFLNKQKPIPLASCQLYSRRMREVFSRACRKNDPDYLKDKLIERLRVEADIHAELVKIDRRGHDDAWADEQVSKLIQEWKKWE